MGRPGEVGGYKFYYILMQFDNVNLHLNSDRQNFSRGFIEILRNALIRRVKNIFYLL